MISSIARECLPCEERERRRNALVGIRRGAIAIQRGVEELLALLEPLCEDADEGETSSALDSDHNP